MEKSELYELDNFIKSLIKGVNVVIENIKNKDLHNFACESKASCESKNEDEAENRDVLKISQKSGYRDLVTQADKGLEKYFTDAIHKMYPSHRILGEETYSSDKSYDCDDLWIIDPIDGTTNFVKQGRDYCTIISYFKSGIPMLSYIYDISSDVLYNAIKGGGVYKNGEKLQKPVDKTLKDSIVSTDIRRMYLHYPKIFEQIVTESFATRSIGSAGLDGVKVVTGERGAYIHSKGGPWDFSAFYLMAEEQGLSFSNFEGKKPDHTKYSSFIIASKGVHADVFLREK